MHALLYCARILVSRMDTLRRLRVSAKQHCSCATHRPPPYREALSHAFGRHSEFHVNCFPSYRSVLCSKQQRMVHRSTLRRA